MKAELKVLYKMKRNIKIILIVFAISLLAGAWLWRYISFNQFYDELSQKGETNIYEIGSVVPFGDNWIQHNCHALGYSLRVDRFEIVDFKSFLSEQEGIESTNPYVPDKLALAYITLSKEKSEDLGVMLTELKMHGIDQVVGMDWELLLALNPILEGNYGIALPDDSECALILPFDLYREYFSSHTWNNLEQYDMFLRMTIWPEEIKVKVQ